MDCKEQRKEAETVPTGLWYILLSSVLNSLRVQESAIGWLFLSFLAQLEVILASSKPFIHSFSYLSTQQST